MELYLEAARELFDLGLIAEYQAWSMMCWWRLPLCNDPEDLW